MRLWFWIAFARFVSGSLPNSCGRFDVMEEELAQLNSLRKTYMDLSTQRVKDVQALQVRIEALRSALPLLPKGKAPMWNEDFRLVADWFEATLEQLLSSDATAGMSREVASFVTAQDAQFSPFLGTLLSEIIDEKQHELSTVSGMVNLHQESERIYASRIALLVSGRRYLLSLCLKDIEATIKGLETKRPAPDSAALQPLRAHYLRYLTLSIQP